MNIIYDDYNSKIVVKKSIFITNIFYVDDINKANSILLDIKKKYFDAKHNCYAYKIGIENSISKQSDDGEPKGTAGLQILSVINNKQLINVLIIVTRYFGGVLLGASLLSRTYADACISCIENIKISKVINAKLVKINFNYTLYNIILNYINKNNEHIFISNNSFDTEIFMELYVNDNFINQFEKDIINLTSNNIVLNIDKNINYSKFENKIKLI